MARAALFVNRNQCQLKLLYWVSEREIILKGCELRLIGSEGLLPTGLGGASCPLPPVLIRPRTMLSKMWGAFCLRESVNVGERSRREKLCVMEKGILVSACAVSPNSTLDFSHGLPFGH